MAFLLFAYQIYLLFLISFFVRRIWNTLLATNFGQRHVSIVQFRHFRECKHEKNTFFKHLHDFFWMFISKHTLILILLMIQGAVTVQWWVCPRSMFLISVCLCLYSRPPATQHVHSPCLYRLFSTSYFSNQLKSARVGCVPILLCNKITDCMWLWETSRERFILLLLGWRGPYSRLLGCRRRAELMVNELRCCLQ